MRFPSGLAGFGSSSIGLFAVVPTASLSPHKLRQVHRTVCSCHSVALSPAHDVARILGSADRHTADPSDSISGARQRHCSSVCASRCVLICRVVRASIGILAARWCQRLRPMYVAIHIVGLALIHTLYREHLVFGAMAWITAVTVFKSLPRSSKIRELPTNWARHTAACLAGVLLILHVVSKSN
jgi:hypothetical protein